MKSYGWMQGRPTWKLFIDEIESPCLTIYILKQIFFKIMNMNSVYKLLPFRKINTYTSESSRIVISEEYIYNPKDAQICKIMQKGNVS